MGTSSRIVSGGAARVLGEKLDVASLRLVERGNVLARNDCELAALDHKPGKGAHYWLCLQDVQTA
jgi:hypothetical protein